MPYFPTVEAHYLTSAGDVIDRICWDYFGITQKTTELTYLRNPFLNQFKAVLPAGLLLVLPVVDEAEVLPKTQLWGYTAPTLPELYLARQRDLYSEDQQREKDAELAALLAYRLERDYRVAVSRTSGAGLPDDGASDGDTGGTGPDTGLPDPDAPILDSWEKEIEPLTVSDFDFVTVWYRNGTKWGVGKIDKASFFPPAPEPGDGGGGSGGFPEGWFPATAQMVVSTNPDEPPTLQLVEILAHTG